MKTPNFNSVSVWIRVEMWTHTFTLLSLSVYKPLDWGVYKPLHCVSGSDEHRALVDMSCTGDRFLSVCTNLYIVCFRPRRTLCTCWFVTRRRSLSLTVYKPLHCVSGSDEHRAPVDLSRSGDRFLLVCTNLYSVFQAQTNIVHLLICHAQEIAFSWCVQTFTPCFRLRRISCTCWFVTPRRSLSLCVYKPLHCVSGPNEHRALVDLSRAGDHFLSVCTNLSTVFQAQTNIVHLLICHAQEIGTVADELYERTCLYGCFQSEDELERSEDLNESKPKKKKKRSGSLQGQSTFVRNFLKTLGLCLHWNGFFQEKVVSYCLSITPCQLNNGSLAWVRYLLP